MRIAFGVVLVTGIFGGLFGDNVFAAPAAYHRVISRGLDGSADEMYKPYVTVSKDRADGREEADLMSRVRDGPQAAATGLGERQKPQQTAYLLVKSLRQRNKRYVSYLTLCHFKICNMGRKRTTRYFHMIRRLDGGNES